MKYVLKSEEPIKFLNYMYYDFEHINNKINGKIVKIDRKGLISGEKELISYLVDNNYNIEFNITKQEEKVLYDKMERVHFYNM